jgi:hypothetical protein
VGLLAKLSFKYGPAGDSPTTTNQRLPLVQRQIYASKRGKTIVQGTSYQSYAFLKISKNASLESTWSPNSPSCHDAPLGQWTPRPTHIQLRLGQSGQLG